jgi:hypothetical protein
VSDDSNLDDADGFRVTWVECVLLAALVGLVVWMAATAP